MYHYFPFGQPASPYSSYPAYPYYYPISPFTPNEMFQVPQDFLPQRLGEQGSTSIKAQTAIIKEEIQVRENKEIVQNFSLCLNQDHPEKDEQKNKVVEKVEREKHKTPIRRRNKLKEKYMLNPKRIEKYMQKSNVKNMDIPKFTNLNKNTESNIVNQIFSYISSQLKSNEQVNKLFGKDSLKVKSFYQFMKTLKKRKKKYINRTYLADLCDLDDGHSGYKLYLREKGSKRVLQRDQIRTVIRKLICYYLDNECILSIATSRKLSPESWKEHFIRRREIYTYLRFCLTEFNQRKIDINI